MADFSAQIVILIFKIIHYLILKANLTFNYLSTILWQDFILSYLVSLQLSHHLHNTTRYYPILQLCPLCSLCPLLAVPRGVRLPLPIPSRYPAVTRKPVAAVVPCMFRPNAFPSGMSDNRLTAI